jgi:hypothetical protein
MSDLTSAYSRLARPWTHQELAEYYGAATRGDQLGLQREPDPQIRPSPCWRPPFPRAPLSASAAAAIVDGLGRMLALHIFAGAARKLGDDVEG